jgi:hypothetical protein
MRDALTPFRVAAPDRGADATMPVALPPRPRPDPAPAHPAIIDDGVGVGTRIVAWVCALALGIGGGYAGYVLATQKDTKAPSSTPPAAAVLRVSSVSAFDPEGDQEENSQDARLVNDGDVATAWSTEPYFNPTTAPKHGVGLALGLARTSRVSTVDITSPDSGYDVQIYVAPEPATTLAGWGEVRATGTNLGTAARIRLATKPPGQFVLIWLTRLPRSTETGPDSQPRFVGRIAEVAIRGTAL